MCTRAAELVSISCMYAYEEQSWTNTVVTVYLFIHDISISRRDGGRNMGCSCANSDYFILRIISFISWPQYRVRFIARNDKISEQTKC